jgi:hypothetical protein
MKQTATMKRTNMILSVGALALVLFTAVVVAATGSSDEYIAWTRHNKVLSWYVGLLFIFPFWYVAYRRSLWGTVLTVAALATSIFRFALSFGRPPRILSEG